MKKIVCLWVCAATLMGAVQANAVGISWSKAKLSEGEMTVTFTGMEKGDRFMVETFSNGVFDSLLMEYAEGESEKCDLTIDSTIDGVRAFVWEQDTMKPKRTSEITTSGMKNKGALFSDNQIINNAAAVGYKSIDVVAGEYEISFDLTVVEKGDNAILLGDGQNGDLGYSTASAILLFNGDSFVVRNGNGTGSYDGDGVTLCPIELNKSYRVSIVGLASLNKYYVTINDGENKYTSEVVASRKNIVSGIDTIGFISNGKNTTVTSDGYYSNFNFYGTNLEVKEQVPQREPMYAYDGFAGLYYGLKVNGSYVKESSGTLSANASSVTADTERFMPRNMGDGSYAIENKGTLKRMKTATSTGTFAYVTNAAYATNSDTQHWVLEKSENYAEDNLSYYLKNLDTGYYVGYTSTTKRLKSVKESSKTEVTFVPLYDDSPLYNISRTEVYNWLTDAQRDRIQTVFETLAGDVFGREGTAGTNTPRTRLEAVFNEIEAGTYASLSEQLSQITSCLSRSTSYLYEGQASYKSISTSLPGTDGLYWEQDNGTAGTYDFWSGTMLDGVLYKYTIYTADGEAQQTINLYVQDHSTAQTNADTFREVLLNIPYEFRRYLHTAKIRNDGANYYNGGGGTLYVRLNWSPTADSMRSTVTHELAHIVDTNFSNWSAGSGWTGAINADMYTVSSYGATNNAEDFAEFVRLYFSAYSDVDMQRALPLIMPERYASFGRLRKNHLGGWGLWEDDYTS